MLFRQLVFAASAAAVPAVKHVVHEERPDSAWTPRAPIHPEAILPVRIGLAQSNLHNAHEWLQAVSDPKSPQFGQHWSLEKVRDTFAPTEVTINAVRDWLHDAGIAPDRIIQSDNKGWLAFDGTAHEAQKLFHTKFYEHEHPSSDVIRIGCQKYHLPSHLVDHVDYVTPGARLVPVKRLEVNRRRGLAKRSRLGDDAHIKNPEDIPSPSAPCGDQMTIKCIRELYGVPPGPKHPHVNNSIGLFESGSFFSEPDMNLYFHTFMPDIPNGTFPISRPIHVSNDSITGSSELEGESNVDVSIATSLVYPQNVTLYQARFDTELANEEKAVARPVDILQQNVELFLDAIDGSYCNSGDYVEGFAPLQDLGTAACGIFKPTSVISISYGQRESSVPFRYAERQCKEFLKLGLRGTSVLVSSGDAGVAQEDGDGIPSNGNQTDSCEGLDGLVFSPSFPATCPYTTTVGATMLQHGQTAKDAETVMSQSMLISEFQKFVSTSSGGFSNYFKQPWYQNATLENYFKHYDPGYPYYTDLPVNATSVTHGFYNRRGRGFPDISANGANFPLFEGGSYTRGLGTSISAPIVASILTLVSFLTFISSPRLHVLFLTSPDQRGAPEPQQEHRWVHQSSHLPPCRCAHRHPHWQKPRMQLERLSRHRRMGPCYWIGHSDLPQIARAVLVVAVTGLFLPFFFPFLSVRFLILALSKTCIL